jgi:5'-nucleotidase
MLIQMDIDGVLADLHTPWYDWYNYLWHDNLRAEDVKTWDLHKYVKPVCGTAVYDFLEYRYIYRDLVKPYPGALNFVNRLQSKHHVIFATSEVKTTGCGGRKWDWLKQWGFKVANADYVELSDKSLLTKDVAIDDRALYLKGAQTRVLFAQPWNHYDTWGKDFDYRINWEDVPRMCDTIDWIGENDYVQELHLPKV